MIRKEDGQLVEMTGDAKPKKERTAEQKSWASALFRCGATGRTIAQARAIFHKETGGYPNCPPFPSPAVWDSKVADVYPKYNRRKV